MKLNIPFAALMVAALLWLGVSQLSQSEAAAPEGIVVHATSYTCDAHPRNPMHPCGPLRWGGDVYSPGMACPVSWRNRYFEVPGYGTLRCDDTPRDGWINGLAHIDIRLPTYAAARRFGVQRITIYPVDSPTSRATLPTPTPDLTTGEGAVRLVHEIVSTGDAQTALARRLTVQKARHYFPALFEGSTLANERMVWLVTLWVPPTEIPAGAKAKPNDAERIAAQFWVLDAQDGEVLLDVFVSPDVVETMGWISSQ